MRLRRGELVRGGVALALVVATAEPAGAQAPGPGATAAVAATVVAEAPVIEADALFHRAGQAYDAGDFKRAHALYGEAFAKKKTHDIAAMLAQTEIKLGRPCEAAAHLDFALGSFPPSIDEGRRARIERARAEVRKRVGGLRVETVPAVATVTIDFEVVATSALPGPFCVAAGDHVVFVSRAGFAVERRTISVEAGSVQMLRAELRALAPATSASTPAALVDPPRPAGAAIDPVPPVTFSLLAAGAAGLLTGAFLLPVARTMEDDADALARRVALGGGTAACAGVSDFAADCARLRALRRDAATFANVGLSAAIFGAVLGAAAGGIFVLRPASAGARPSAASLAVGVSPHGAQVALTGVF